MKTLLRHVLASVLFAVLFTGLILLPDYLFKYFVPKSAMVFDHEFAIVLFILGLLLSLNSSRKLAVGIFSLMFVLQLIDLFNYAYFGAHISPFALAIIGEEAGEIMESGLASWKQIYFVPPILLVCYAALYVVYRVFGKFTHKTKIAGYLAATIFLIYPIRAMTTSDVIGFLPSPSRCSIYNAYRSGSLAIVQPFKNGASYDFSVHNQPITASFTSPKAKNIIVIMGESCNPDHMSLYGYERDTTPLLKELSSDPNFFKTTGLSASIATKASLTLFFTLMREPGHQRMLLKDPVGLFKLAKQQGYKTFWISGQSSYLLLTAASEDIDVFITNDGWNKPIFEKHGDMALLDYIQKQELGEKNFIVLHQRTPHSPYDACYKAHPEFKKYPESKIREEDTINKYDNAIHFSDFVLSNIINHFKERLKDASDTYIFFTSDHGEAMGEDGKFGHCMMIPIVFKVPMFAYALNPTQNHLAQFNALKSHYELGKMIAGLMGAIIHNPNEKEGEHFVHHKDIFGNNEILRITIDSEGKRQYDKTMSLTSYYKKES